MLAVIAGTSWGIGISPDSVVYIAGARSLALGEGFSIPSISGTPVPITFRAPLYSVFLAVFSLFGMEPMQGARLLNALLFGITIYIVGNVMRTAYGENVKRSFWLPVLGSFFVLVSALMLEIHLMAWSEAAFIVLSLGGLISLGRYLDYQKIYALVVSSILIGLAVMTRYAGVALVGASGLGIILFGNSIFRRRVGNAILFGILSLLPITLWISRNQFVGGTTTGRELIFHPIGINHVKQALTTISSWLLIPQNASAVIKIIPLLLIIMGFILVTISNKDRANTSKKDAIIENVRKLPGIIKLILVFLPVYGIFLIVSITFLDANTPLDGRILSFVYVTGLILVGYIVVEILRLKNNFHKLQVVLLLICSAFAVTYVLQGSSLLITSNREGLGFNSAYWHQSELLALIDSIPETLTIFTNSTEAIYIHTNRSALSLPKKFDSANKMVNENYQEELSDIASAVKSDKAVIVYFYTVRIPTMPTEEELHDNIPGQIWRETGDGVIFGSISFTNNH